MKRSKYYIRVMRPTFQRAILTVEAASEQAAAPPTPTAGSASVGRLRRVDTGSPKVIRVGILMITSGLVGDVRVEPRDFAAGSAKRSVR